MHSKLHKFLTVLVSLVSLSIFLLPFSSVYSVGNEGVQGFWKSVYLTDDWISLSFYLPFFLLWCIYLIKMPLLNSKLFRFLLALLALVAFALSLLSAGMPAQDYEPQYGVFLSLLILPLLVLFLFNYTSMKKKRNIN